MSAAGDTFAADAPILTISNATLAPSAAASAARTSSDSATIAMRVTIDPSSRRATGARQIDEPLDGKRRNGDAKSVHHHAVDTDEASIGVDERAT